MHAMRSRFTMFARPAVRQAAMACSRNSTGVGRWFDPTRRAEWSDITDGRNATFPSPSLRVAAFKLHAHDKVSVSQL